MAFRPLRQRASAPRPATGDGPNPAHSSQGVHSHGDRTGPTADIKKWITSEHARVSEAGHGQAAAAAAAAATIIPNLQRFGDDPNPDDD